MASTTFIELTNRLLRRINEVEIAQSDFASTRGVHALAKDAINASVFTINQMEAVWPFNATTGTQVLDIGVEEYDWPSNYLLVNWNSFSIEPDDLLGVTGAPLKFIPREMWIKQQRIDDVLASTDGSKQPEWVFEKHGNGFGVSPSPDRAYTVTYEYWQLPVSMVDYDDTSTIPSNFDEVIIQGALVHLYMFRDNDSQSTITKVAFKELVSNMRTLLINKDDRVTGSILSTQSTSGPWAIPVGGWYA